jgi:hypothetical protein
MSRAVLSDKTTLALYSATIEAALSAAEILASRRIK